MDICNEIEKRIKWRQKVINDYLESEPKRDLTKIIAERDVLSELKRDYENSVRRQKDSEREQANELLPHVSGSALLNELIPLLISYFYPTNPASNSDEMFKKRLQIIEILNDFKAD